MATETDFRHQNPQSVSVSSMLDHGSISFGRFSAESLAWEKWSVFSHNRYREELEKFNFPGFVAQKKAYFEDYYRKVRTMKASQTQQKEALGPDLYQEEPKSHITQAGSNVGHFQTSDNENSTDHDSALEGKEKERVADTKEVLSGSSWISNNASMESSRATTPDQSTKKTALLPRLGTRNSVISQRDKILVSDSAKQIAIKSRSRGNVASSRSITKTESKSKKDGTKSSEKTKPSLDDGITVKTESSSAVLGKSRTLKAKGGNNQNPVSSNRKRIEVCSGSTVLRSPMTRNKLLSSSDGKRSQLKTNSNPIDGTEQSSERSAKETGSGLRKVTDYRLKNTDLGNKLDLKSGVGFSQRSCDRERKKEEGDKNISFTSRTSNSSTTTSNNHNKNLKLVPKNTISLPRNLAETQQAEAARPKIPSWR